MNPAHTKYLLHLEERLRSLGAQEDIDIPCVVVIGNQSAGKSSLLESISGISIPRDANISTRTPFHYRMRSTSQPFSVQVHLRYEFDYDGQRKREVAEFPFGSPLFNKSDVEPRLRQAQAAILLHLSDVTEIDTLLEMSALELSSKMKETSIPRVSQNVVCVDVRGPNLANLAFFDLPGFIQVGPEKTLIEDLVRSYIKGNCIILMVLAMNGDFESHGAIEFIRQVDPEGQRTIGVLTKPDLADVGDHSTRDLWYSVLTGRMERLKYGYYCTRQPTERERESQVTKDQARAQEMEFFKNTLPYSTSSDQSRFGTANLVSTVSDLLIKLIIQSIPKMQARVQATLKETVSALSKLPEPAPKDHMAHALNLLRDFGDHYRRATEGGPREGHLIQNITKAFREFRINISTTAPNFCPFPDLASSSTIFINSLDGSVVTGQSSPPRQYLKDLRAHIQRTVTRELPGNVPFEANRRLIHHFQTSWPDMVKQCQDSVKDIVVEELKHGIVAIFSNYSHLMGLLEALIDDLVKGKFDLTTRHTLVILEVEQGPNTLHGHDLQAEEAKWMKKYSDDIKQPLASSPVVPLPSNTPRPQSLDSDDTNKSSASPPTIPRSFNAPPPRSLDSNDTNKSSDPHPPASWVFNTPPPRSLGSSDTNKSSDPHPPAPWFFKTPQATPFAAKPTPIPFWDAAAKGEEILSTYRAELKLMAEVRAYFDLAYKRMVDSVKGHIDVLFVQGIAKDLFSFMLSGLDITGPNATERCAAFLAEDPVIARQRADLISKQKRLQGAQEELTSYMNKLREEVRRVE